MKVHHFNDSPFILTIFVRLCTTVTQIRLQMFSMFMHNRKLFYLFPANDHSSLYDLRFFLMYKHPFICSRSQMHVCDFLVVVVHCPVLPLEKRDHHLGLAGQRHFLQLPCNVTKYIYAWSTLGRLHLPPAPCHSLYFWPLQGLNLGDRSTLHLRLCLHP